MAGPGYFQPDTRRYKLSEKMILHLDKNPKTNEANLAQLICMFLYKSRVFMGETKSKPTKTVEAALKSLRGIYMGCTKGPAYNADTVTSFMSYLSIDNKATVYKKLADKVVHAANKSEKKDEKDSREATFTCEKDTTNRLCCMTLDQEGKPDGITCKLTDLGDLVYAINHSVGVTALEMEDGLPDMGMRQTVVEIVKGFCDPEECGSSTPLPGGYDIENHTTSDSEDDEPLDSEDGSS